jgi:hypothetical protein
MKMTVITDKKGAVVATYRHEEEYKEGQARFRLNALAGQSIRAGPGNLHRTISGVSA